jgi:hypothetical protein
VDVVGQPHLLGTRGSLKRLTAGHSTKSSSPGLPRWREMLWFAASKK